jgi:hypothetical protein
LNGRFGGGRNDVAVVMRIPFAVDQFRRRFRFDLRLRDYLQLTVFNAKVILSRNRGSILDCTMLNKEKKKEKKPLHITHLHLRPLKVGVDNDYLSVAQRHRFGSSTVATRLPVKTANKYVSLSYKHRVPRCLRAQRRTFCLEDIFSGF